MTSSTTRIGLPPLVTAVVLIILVFSSSPAFTSAQGLDGLDGRDAWPPVAPRINATVSPWLVWTFDWTVVGCSFFAAFGGLSNGPMAALTIQRFRALRQPIAQQCSWKKQYEALIATENSTSIIDRADTPVGFGLEVEGGKPERFVIGAIWFNFGLGVVVLLLQIAAAHVLENYTTKKAIEKAGGNKEEALHATSNFVMDNPKSQFFYVATKWGFGRCLTGVVVLPFYSAFRLSMIILGNGTSSSSVLTQCRLGVALHMVCIAMWMLVAPSMASRRCFSQNRAIETRNKMKKSFLAWLLEDRVLWRFEKIDDFKAMIVVASIENVNQENRWWVVPIELFVTAAIDLVPLAATNPNDEANACFANNLAGLLITTALWWFILYLRPFQRRLQHMCWFIQLSMQNFSYLLGVLQEQQTAPVPKKRMAFIVLCFVSCFTTIFVTFLFTFMGLIRRLIDRYYKSKETGVAVTFQWDTELLSMLQQDQAVKGGSGRGDDTVGGGVDDGAMNELSEMLNSKENNSKSSSAIGNGNHPNTTTTSLALPSVDYSPASKAEFTLDDDDFLQSFLNSGDGRPSATTTNNDNNNNDNDDNDDAPPPPPPPPPEEEGEEYHYDVEDAPPAPLPLEEQQESPSSYFYKNNNNSNSNSKQNLQDGQGEYEEAEDTEGYYDEDGNYHFYETDADAQVKNSYQWL